MTLLVTISFPPDYADLERPFEDALLSYYKTVEAARDAQAAWEVAFNKYGEWPLPPSATPEEVDACNGWVVAIHNAKVDALDACDYMGMVDEDPEIHFYTP